ncbi:MAG: glycosyltransferase [Bacteroidales bacterium]|nr:glycosyltransferase [Bacteroidales bacterium]
MILNKVKNKIKAVLFPFLGYPNGWMRDVYVSRVGTQNPWAYVSYIADVFYELDNDEYLASHQNVREAVEIVRALNRQGMNVYVQTFHSAISLPALKNVRLVFGVEPNYNRACQLYKDAYMIYYATGAYAEHQNNQVIVSTNAFNEKYGSNLPYRRLLSNPHSADGALVAYEYADKMLMIGSSFTLATFPVHLQKKISFIRQSTQELNVMHEVTDAPENEFLFIGSYGNVLKGIPLLVDFFSTHRSMVIHIVGPLESDLMEALKNSLTPNIIFHGRLNLNSANFKTLVSTCNFIVYPSGSEGSPGSVLCAMKFGMIPIVTPWAAFDEIKDYGYVMKDWSIDALADGILWAVSLKPDSRLKYKQRCAEYARNNYTIDLFRAQINAYFEKILHSKGI